MAWIESHEELRHHEKVIKLCRVLEIGKPQALGHLHLLWWWVAKYREKGILTEVSTEEICDAAEWKGERNLFVSALKATKFLDSENGVLAVHDWNKYGIKYLLSGRKRKRKHDKEQQKKKRNSNVTETLR